MAVVYALAAYVFWRRRDRLPNGSMQRAASISPGAVKQAAGTGD
jgi:hypothetical protein